MAARKTSDALRNSALPGRLIDAASGRISVYLRSDRPSAFASCSIIGRVPTEVVVVKPTVYVPTVARMKRPGGTPPRIQTRGSRTRPFRMKRPTTTATMKTARFCSIAAPVFAITDPPHADEDDRRHQRDDDHLDRTQKDLAERLDSLGGPQQRGRTRRGRGDPERQSERQPDENGARVHALTASQPGRTRA